MLKFLDLQLKLPENLCVGALCLFLHPEIFMRRVDTQVVPIDDARLSALVYLTVLVTHRVFIAVSHRSCIQTAYCNHPTMTLIDILQIWLP